MRSAWLPEPLSVQRVHAIVCLLVASLGCSDRGLGLAGPASGGLVFIREWEGNAELMRARLSDQSVERITRTPEREERWPYWSSVTGLVVFQVRSYAASLMTDIQLWDPTTGEERTVTRTARRDERWPTWSPSTSQLAYAFKSRRGPSGVALYDAETGTTRLVARSGPHDFFLRPQFAPDGRRLVASRQTRTRGSRLWLLEPGRSPRILTKDPNLIDGKAYFAPDGASVVFTRRLSQGGPGNIARLDLATGGVSPLASRPESDDHSGRLSPVRDELGFVSDRDGSTDIFLVELPDGVPRNLTRTPKVNEGAPRWSPDGELLAILRWEEPSADAASRGEIRPDPAKTHIAVIDRSGHLLFETPGRMADWMPAWP